MADYSSLKVADLKAELKTRGIPQTGLRLKQHFIDKLLEEDAKSQTGDAAPGAEPEESEATQPEPEQPEAQPEPTDPAPQAQEPQPEQPQTETPGQSKALVTEETEPSQAVPTPDTTHEEKKQPTPPTLPAPEQATDNGDSAENELPAPAAPTEPYAEATREAAEPEPIEQAPGIADQIVRADFAMSAENPRLSAPVISEANTGLSTPLPIEEALEDKRKRKRRSQSPVPTPEAIANKRARAKDETSRATSQEDKLSVPGEESKSAQASPGVQKKESSVPAKDARFKGLFAPAEPAHSPAKDVNMEDADVEPARHPATTSLYIDGLMRPLQPAALRKHLISVASPSGDAAVIQEFFLDSIKTHCFVQFSDITSASRVRSALHGTIWPDERNRRNLWVDFIPDEKVREWIRTEEASQNRAGPPVRWEVQYETTDNGTTATLAEAGAARSAPSRPREPGFNRTPPLGPRGSYGQVERASNAPPAARPGQGFKPLDELFKSTTTKPKLYYLPVPRPVADKRLDQFDELLRKGEFRRRGGDETRRITFEDDDHFVDVGPEYGAAAMQRRQERGRGRGRRP